LGVQARFVASPGWMVAAAGAAATNPV
jgi:hypothetical protein